MKKIQFYIMLLITISFLVLAYSILIGYQNFDLVKTTGISFYAWLNAQSPFLAGAIGVWILGVGTFVIRYIPKSVWNIIVKQATITLVINNDMDSYRQFFKWYEEAGNSNQSRTLTVVESPFITETKDGWVHTSSLSAGYGIHYFFFNKHIFKIVRIEKDASNTVDTKESVIIRTIGRSHKPFEDLLESIKPAPIKKRTVTCLYIRRDAKWVRYDYQTARPFKSVILPQETKETLINHIENFFKEKSWYLNHGIPYRTGIILYGPPGTGKTSVIKGLCEYFDKPLYMLNLNNIINDEALLDAFMGVPANSIILLEDIDTYSVTSERSSEDTTNSDKNCKLFGITLSGLLNAIDGIISSDGRILIATTNHIKKLDGALVRKGRFNISIELSYLTDECFIEFFNKFYPNFNIPSGVSFKQDIPPATLQGIIMDNINNPKAVLEYCADEDIDNGLPALYFSEDSSLGVNAS